MDQTEELVDLSLFAVSPTDDRHFAVSDRPSPPYLSTRSAYTDNTLRAYAENTLRQHDYHSPRSCTMKPLPPLPSRRLGGRRGCPLQNRVETQSSCILRRIRRPHRPDDPPPFHHNTITQRRHIPPPPQLTLSVPQPTPQRTRSCTSPSPMVWLPNEQMWLISDEAHPDAYREAYDDSLPTYTRRNYSRSESPPATRGLGYDLTPPLTPVQDQLRSLLEPREAERALAAAVSGSSEPMQGEMPRAPAMADWSASWFPPSEEVEVVERETASLLSFREQDTASLLPSRGTSFRSVVSAFDNDDNEDTDRPAPTPSTTRCRWECMAHRVARPKSTI